MTETRRRRLAICVRIVAWVSVLGGLLMGKMILDSARTVAQIAIANGALEGNREVLFRESAVAGAIDCTGISVIAGGLVAGFGLRILRVATLSKVANVEE